MLEIRPPELRNTRKPDCTDIENTLTGEVYRRENEAPSGWAPRSETNF